MNGLINKELIMKAWVFLRKNEHTIPNETFDFMREKSIEALNDNWISVKEELPKNGELVLVYRKTKTNKNDIQLFHWFSDDKELFTHWMDLPEPPKQ